MNAESSAITMRAYRSIVGRKLLYRLVYLALWAIGVLFFFSLTSEFFTINRKAVNPIGNLTTVQLGFGVFVLAMLLSLIDIKLRCPRCGGRLMRDVRPWLWRRGPAPHSLLNRHDCPNCGLDYSAAGDNNKRSEARSR